MDRDTAVRTWRDVCGNDTVMAMGVVTGRMLEEFARRIEAAERKRIAAGLTKRAEALNATGTGCAPHIQAQYEAMAGELIDLACTLGA